MRISSIDFDLNMLKPDMHSIAKRYAKFLQHHPRKIIVFWLFLTIFFVIASVSLEITQGYEERHILFLLDGRTEIRRETLPTLVIYCVLSPILLFCLTLSIPIAFSSFLSSIIVCCSLHLTHCLVPLIRLSPLIPMITGLVSTANMIGLRKSYNDSRKGPCEATMNRLLISCIDKSLRPCLYTTLLLSTLPLLLLAMDPIKNGPTVIMMAVLAWFQNMTASSNVLAMLIVRQESSLACPGSSRSFFSSIWDRIEKQILFSLHFVHKHVRRILSSCMRILIIIIFLTSSAVFGTILIFDALRSTALKNSSIEQTECKWPECFPTIIGIPLILLTPLPILLITNKHRWSSVIAITSMLSSFLATCTVIVLLKFPTDFLHFVIIAVIAMDGPLRLCLSHTLSRKIKPTARVLDSLDSILPQALIPMLWGAGISGYNYFDTEKKIWLVFATALITSSLYTVVFCPAAMMFCGKWSFCGGDPIQECYSESRSIAAENLLGASRFSTRPDRRFSAANTYGVYKKRSVGASPDTRRASMPVLMHSRVAKKTWAELAKNCGSMDSCTSPSSSRVIMKKEPLLNSRGSLISAASLSIVSHAIREDAAMANL